jgi:hypothetical protein
MRTLNLLAAGLLALLLESSAAQAQAKKTPAAPVETTRYFQLSEDFFGELPTDGFLKEVRQGAKVVSAVLDLCHSVSQTSSRKDRFVVPLKLEGTKLTGTGQSQEAKLPITVSLVRKQTGKTVAFDGFITRGDTKATISSTENTDVDEKEFLENQAAGPTIDAAPAAFTEVTPGSVGIRVKREALGGLVKELKGQNVQLTLSSVAPDCSSLRTGEHAVRIVVDPERAPALVNQLKSSSGVSAAGWTSGSHTIERAIRLAAADWKGSDGNLDKARLAAAIAGAAAKNFGATADSSDWNSTTGELKVVLKRPSQSVPGLDLTDSIELVALVGPEKPGSNQGLVVWFGDPGIDIVDNGPEPRLKFASTTSEEAGLIDDDAMLTLLAQELKGKRWDSDQSTWQK